MANYTASDAISAYLGVTFTPEQAQQAEQVAAAVTAFVDRYTGRSWQAISPVAGEMIPVLPARSEYPGTSGLAYLKHAPAVAVSAVGLRTTYPNATETALDPSQFELIDPAHGTLVVSGVGWCGGLLAVVDYTYADAVPADIALAATMIAAGEMGRQLAIQASSAFAAAHPETAGLKSVSVGQNDVNVSFATTSAATSGGAASGASLAPEGSAARAILDLYRRVVLA